jgi:glycolate oxidase iron-sulfur subunit
MFDYIDDYPGDNVSYPPNGLYIPDATECMRCGLCISLCPTYKVFRIEAETPRSRVRTIDKIINGNTTVSDEELKHLNNCTQCRACETICPSKMAYGHLFDLAREQRFQGGASERRANLLSVMGFKLIEHKALLNAATVLIRLYQKSGLQLLLRKSALLRMFKLDKAESLMPEVDSSKLAERYPTDVSIYLPLYKRGIEGDLSNKISPNPSFPKRGTERLPTGKQHRGNVALFTGCISDHFDRKTLLASIKMLNAIGFDVLVPKQQTCCGAIHQHQGNTAIADKMAALNTGVFNALDVDAIIYTASGCGLMLNEYEQGNGDEASDPKKFSHSLYDITEFLNLNWPDDISLKNSYADTRKVAVHEPCSQRNVPFPSRSLGTRELGSQGAWSRHQHVFALLEKIPGITVIPLPENQICCGAGGIHMLTHPEIAEPLRDTKLAHFEQSQADVLVSTNIACALHMNTGPALNKVVHPVVLLAELLT